VSNLLQVCVLIAIPVVATVIGAAAAIRRRPGPKLISGVQHFAAGVVLAAVAGEVLPSLKDEGHLGWAVCGFLAGIGLVLVLEVVSEREKAHEEKVRKGLIPKALKAALPLGMLIPVAVDLFMDGILVGLGASLGMTQAVILTIALTLEVLFLGVALVAVLRESGQTAGMAVLWCFVVSLSMVVGALGGVLLLGGASKAVMAFALAFGAAALLYLAVEELLLEAHENAETPLLTAMFFVGFIVIYVLSEVGSGMTLF
jgi:ZIP family zinc transporter